MSQSKRHSLIESVVQQGTGFVLSLLVWEFVVKPVWNIQTNLAESLSITLLFTLVSVARSYCFRRLFNHLHIRATQGASHESL